jgi:uncharacterized delta-60 repeat protein
MWFRSSHQPRPGPSTCRLRLEPLEDRCLLSGGVLDPTFGTAGMVTTNVPPITGSNSWSFAQAVATYPNAGTANDGKVVAAGAAIGSSHGRSTAIDNFAIVRYNQNGSLDASFGGTGQVLTDLGGKGAVAEDLAIQPDGKIVALGFSAVGSTASQLALVRYNVDGSLDTSFGGTGKVLDQISKGSSDSGFRVALQSDGKIVVAGFTSGGLLLERYNANGTLDTNFGTGGKVTASTGPLDNAYNSDYHIDLAIDPNTSPDPNAGKIVVVQGLQSGVVVDRFNTNGSPDKTFGAGAGSVTISPLSTSVVAVQSDDRIIVAGAFASTSGHAIELDRFNADGTPDATFGSAGQVVTPMPNAVPADA